MFFSHVQFFYSPVWINVLLPSGTSLLCLSPRMQVSFILSTVEEMRSAHLYVLCEKLVTVSLLETSILKNISELRL